MTTRTHDHAVSCRPLTVHVAELGAYAPAVFTSETLGKGAVVCCDRGRYVAPVAVLTGRERVLAEGVGGGSYERNSAVETHPRASASTSTRF